MGSAREGGREEAVGWREAVERREQQVGKGVRETRRGYLKEIRRVRTSRALTSRFATNFQRSFSEYGRKELVQVDQITEEKVPEEGVREKGVQVAGERNGHGGEGLRMPGRGSEVEERWGPVVGKMASVLLATRVRFGWD